MIPWLHSVMSALFQERPQGRLQVRSILGITSKSLSRISFNTSVLFALLGLFWKVWVAWLKKRVTPRNLHCCGLLRAPKMCSWYRNKHNTHSVINMGVFFLQIDTLKAFRCFKIVHSILFSCCKSQEPVSCSFLEHQTLTTPFWV